MQVRSSVIVRLATYSVYEDAYVEHWSLYDDVRPVLDALPAGRLGIISNGNSVNQREKLRRTGIFHLFSMVLISSDIGVAKPDPRIFEEGAMRLGVEPHACVYVGDPPKRGLGFSSKQSRSSGVFYSDFNAERPNASQASGIGRPHAS